MPSAPGPFAYRATLLVTPMQRVTPNDLLGYACLAVSTDVLSADHQGRDLVSLSVRFLADSDEHAEQIAKDVRASVMSNSLSGDPIVLRRGRLSRWEREQAVRPVPQGSPKPRKTPTQP